MSDLTQQLDQLSPEKRALLIRQLQKKRAQAAQKAAIPRRADQNSFPLSYAQERLWTLQQLEPDSPFYNIAVALRLNGRLDVAALAQSLNTVIARHEALRARFGTVHGSPVQIIAPEVRLTLEVEDVAAAAQANGRSTAPEALALKMANEEAARPFDLQSGPLLRARLLRLRPAEHLFLLTFHHIIIDGWSTRILIEEVALLYGAYAAGREAALPELAIQYADFAAWQQQWLRGDLATQAPLEKQLAYWKEQLRGAPEVLELLTDHPRPVVQTVRGAIERFTLPPAVSDGLKALSREANATLFMTLLAAFQTLLHRYTYQDDICVGTAVANRNHPEIEKLIGFFVNSVVMRAAFRDGLTFRELLAQVRETTLGAQAHQDLPFEMLVDELKPQRDLSRTPLFQVMFDLESRSPEALVLADLQLAPIETHSGTSKVDLTLFMVESGAELSGSIEYNTDLFEAATIARMVGHFQNLLAAIAQDPDAPASRLPLLTAAERHQLLVEWNDTATNYPREKSLQALFAEQVAQRPEATAVRYGDVRLTYAELNAQANRLAHYLRSRDVGPGSLVGVYMERSPEMMVAFLGIIKAGGAYVPLDTAYPTERLAFMLDDTQVPVLLTQTHLRDNVPASQAELLCLDTEWDAVIAPFSTADPDIVSAPDDLAYIIYTSGSTGRPKGVAIPQQAIVRLVRNTNYIDLTPEDRIAQVSNASFDAATFEIWGAWLNGGELIGITKDIVLSSRDFANELREQSITAIFLTTALFNHLAKEEPGAFATINHLMFGGEASDPRWVQSVLDNNPPRRLLHVYGPTESTTYASWLLVESVRKQAKTVPIGKPLANTTLYVVDKHFQQVPIGAPGELCIGGDGLAQQYWKRPRITAEKFIPDPFSPTPGARLYRTGDLVRLLPGGAVEFLGRIDFQVKIRGFRVEMGEIETLFKQHPTVQDALVTVYEETPGNRQLVAYFTSKGAQSEVSELRRYLKAQLPEYMVPAFFIPLEAFPINPNGKVDRRALPRPEAARSELDRSFVAPRTAVEHYLARKWQEVLGLERVGIYDNFFEIGGNSLQAAVLINRLQEDLEETAHVRALFMAPTIAELALYMGEYYPHTVARITGEEPATAVESALAEKFGDLRVVEGVTPAKVQQIRALIPPLPAHPDGDPAEKNPPAVFLLSPPRSGSTLLRVMLEGSPDLFAPPELDLLSFNTLAERRGAFSGEYAFWLEGPIRAIMEIQGCDVEEAQAIMAGFEQQGMSTRRFYRQLQEWVGDRLLVDKTPVYALDMHILERAESDFAGARYVHLMRHPYGSVYSFIEARLDQLFFRHSHPFALRELAELVWIISHQNIQQFLQRIPAERQHLVRFEDLVRHPQPVMRDLCRFLGIDLHPAMLLPYDGDKMTSGVAEGKQMVGDFKFYLRSRIDPEAADRWRKFHSEDFLSDVAWEVGAQLGYHPDAPTPTAVSTAARQEKITPIPRDGELPLSFAQQRLWFLDQFESGTALYNVPAAVRLNGVLDVRALGRALNTIVARHEVLRASYTAVDGRAQQIIHPYAFISLPIIDLQDLSVADQEARVDELAADDARRPYDLSQAPLLRATLLRLDAEDHVLLLNLHHIVSDGWSIGVLIQEIAVLYAAFAADPTAASPLPELPVQYVDYAHWQRNWLQSGVLERQLAYWEQQLGGAPPLLELPTDRPRPPVQTQNGARLITTLPATLSANVKALSHAEGATLFMTLLAAFKILLYRYSGQDDISVGTPIAGRNRPEIEGLIGFFVNTLVLRSDLSAVGGAPSFRELLRRVRLTALGAFDNQDVPFEMLVDRLEPQRDMSHTPLFQVMFTLQDAPIETLQMPGLTFSPVNADSGTAKFDLLLTVAERKDGFKCAFEYNTDLFNGDTIGRLAGHFETLLAGIVANPDQPIDRLPLITPTETWRLLKEWNDTAVPYPHNQTIVQRFEAQVARTPEATAVVYGADTLTYAELNRRANQLAHTLRRRDVGPETIVGLAVERSTTLLVGLIGILKAGAAYLPLDPTYPPERLAYMLADSGAALVLTTQTAGFSAATNADGPTPHIIHLDADWPTIAQQPDTNPSASSGQVPHSAFRTPQSANMAYIIYTSGSTGQPKGVVIPHQQALHLATALHERIYVNHGERPLRITLNAPLSFDASVQQWIMLTYGHALYVVPDELRLDGFALLDWIRANQLDLVDCVPSQLKLLLAAGLLDGAGWTPQAMLPGGEPIDQAAWDQLRAAPATEFYNMYGPTECSVDSIFGRVRELGATPSIGRPATNTQVYILDAAMQPAPVGVPGEIVIGDAAVGRGYLNRPALTAEKFIPDPFSREPGARLYRSGDLGRYRADGTIEFLGRIDHQVKVRGFRIELGEIEAALKQHPAVQDSACIVREDTPGVRRLAAYLTPRGDAAPTVGELRQHLLTRLPDYMVPALFVTLDALPLLPNGKVNRRALPAPDQERPELEAAFVAPRTSAEETLAAIWRQVLGLEQVGVHDNFFELGGDSILSIQIIARAKQAGLQLTPRQLFEHPTVAGLASVAGTGPVIQAEQGLSPARRR
jgi:amino acid adenylation domain-containing protein